MLILNQVLTAFAAATNIMEAIQITKLPYIFLYYSDF